MSGIQIIMILGVVALFAYYFFRLRSAFFDLFFILICTMLSIFFILAPQLTNIIAHKIGVGRGADLLFYLCILFFLFLVLKLTARIRKLEKNITELTRFQAHQNAKFLKDSNE